MKKITLSESELTKIIQKIVTKKLNEDSADINQDGIITPEELYQHFDLDGDGVVTMVDYAAHVDFHCENPELLDQYRDSEEYLEKMSDDREPFAEFFEMNTPIGKLAVVGEQEEYDDDDDDEDAEEVNRYPVNDLEFELSDSDINDIMSEKGQMRRYRGSIYIDGIVPETDDREYDRKLAIKILENYAKKLPTAESYIGGAGFKQRSLTAPYDNMDF
tara:strand:- start:2301 stop:2951 length:651 start_codon:yes stop_codon:yes gene_type:complete